VCGWYLGDGVSEAPLGLPKDARLRVVVPLPGQLSRGAVAQPHKDTRNGVRHILRRCLPASATATFSCMDISLLQRYRIASCLRGTACIWLSTPWMLKLHWLGHMR
jgi:peptidoglycan biosynthesis protein MviN/MurJ (putative lipid II flippase)